MSTENQVRVLAYVSDFSATGKLKYLRKWWNTLTIIGRKFGYYPEPTKRWLLLKPYALQQTNKIYSGTKIKITNEGYKYLGRAVGTEEFKDTYVEEKLWNRLINLKFCIK